MLLMKKGRGLDSGQNCNCTLFFFLFCYYVLRTGGQKRKKTKNKNLRSFFFSFSCFLSCSSESTCAPGGDGEGVYGSFINKRNKLKVCSFEFRSIYSMYGYRAGVV